jgi:AcrR family transcriptional regulator
MLRFSKFGGFFMARITDPQKIESVRRAVMEIVAEKGFRKISISAIAKKAEVSVGYLYRYYESKEALLDELFDNALLDIGTEMIDIIMDNNNTTIKDIIWSEVSAVFNLAKLDPTRAKLLATLVLDSDIDSILRKGDKKLKNDILETFMSIGRKTGELADEIEKEDVFLIISSVPFRYIMLKLKEANVENFFNQNSIDRIARICYSALL